MRNFQFGVIGAAVVIAVIGIIAVPAFVSKYNMMSFDLTDESSMPLGIAETGWDPVTVAGYRKKKATKKKATLWKKVTVRPWAAEELPVFDSAQDSWANDVEVTWDHPVSMGRNFEAVGMSADQSGLMRPVRWMYSGNGPWSMDPFPTLGGEQGEVLGIIYLPYDLLMGNPTYGGWSETMQGTKQATIWMETPNGIMAYPLDGTSGMPSRVNAGVYSMTDLTYLGIGAAEDNGMPIPMLWSWSDDQDPTEATATPLPLLDGGLQGEATVIIEGDPGVVTIAGWSENSESNIRPVAWDRDGETWVVEDLGVIAGDVAGRVLGGILAGDEYSLVGTSIPEVGKAKRKTSILWRKTKVVPSWSIDDLSQIIVGEQLLLPEVATGVDAKGRVIGYGPHPPDPIATPTQADTTGPYAFVLSPEPASGTGDTPAASGELSVEVFPNPFNPTVTVEFTAPRSGRAKVTVHDAKGRWVATLFDGGVAAGDHPSLRWDGTEGSGESAASGVYFVRVRSAGEVTSRKVVLLK